MLEKQSKERMSEGSLIKYDIFEGAQELYV